MNTMTAICSRKSVRSYTGEKISDEELNTILKAAYAAPVGMAKFDTLQLSVVTCPDYLKKLDTAAAVAFGNPDMHPLYGAPTLVIVSSLMTGTPADSVALANGACIVENMSLAAVELGVGTVHIWGAINALKQNPDLVAALDLPEGYAPICSIALGKTEEVYEEREVSTDKIKTAYI